MYDPIEEKRLDTYVDTDYPGDMPDEIDQWFSGMMGTEELTSEGKKVLLKMFEGDSKNAGIYRLIKESIGEEDGRQEDE
jgi:hypothetical protein